MSIFEWSYNTSYQTSLNMTPFEVLYGYTPLKLAAYAPGIASNDLANKELRDGEHIRLLVHHNLPYRGTKLYETE